MLLTLALALAAPLAAQQRQPTLEELIPDEAVANPEAWATGDQTQPPETEDAAELDGDIGEVLSADAPMAELPDLTVDWPESLDLPPIERLATEPDARLAGSQRSADDDDDDDEAAELAAATEVEVGSQLVLAFPGDEVRFPERDAVVDRFAGLSNVRELDDSEGNVAQLSARARADEALLGEVLRVYGYYDAQVIRSIARGRRARDEGEERQARVRFDVVPGERYRFGEIVLGNLSAAPDYEQLRAVFGIQPGEPISSDRIIEQQFALDRALGETGYPFARIDEPDLVIDHAARDGDLTLPVEPAGKYAFGEVTSSLPEFLSGRHLARIARFDAGDIYQRSLELDLRRAIVATGLVSSVTITPRETAPPVGDEPGVVALDIALTKAPLRTMSGAIGYGSEEGFRLEASWEHRNLFPPEGSLRVRGVLGTMEQFGGVTFRKNNFGGRDKIMTLDAYASNLTTQSVEARTIALRGTYERVSNLLFQKPFSWAAGAEVLYTDERNRVLRGIPRPRQEYLIGSVFGRATLDATDSLLDPTRGFRLTGYLAPEVSRNQGRQVVYLRNQADASFYQSVGSGAVVAARGRFASIIGAKTFEVAPSRRLYAGGGSSVRGYGYQAVGPRNNLGEPTGGRSLAEFSIEARVDTGLFDGALQVVPFLDIGTVSLNSVPDFSVVKYGAGLGVRYKTGFGPIRVDVGVPLNRDPTFDSPVAVYVSLGQAF